MAPLLSIQRAGLSSLHAMTRWKMEDIIERKVKKRLEEGEEHGWRWESGAAPERDWVWALLGEEYSLAGEDDNYQPANFLGLILLIGVGPTQEIFFW
uniref:Uncharacterized protein n=1 Tax=Arundo donax TaxID=35708 RepID=A0A0A8YK93_ARUDO